ncbi:MAG: single-stranded-DNA-specific exonuclease RecJ [Deltaproteobacteria bacterium]|nr:single-stranded-DNA-specific exonuclease RecJ [Deltaproteobacteria bacterium]
MTAVSKRWQERFFDRGRITQLSQALPCLPLIASVLVRRGLTDAAAAQDFLSARLNSLPDPALLPDLIPAVQRLDAAVRKGEKIGVHGDYDVDGISGTALLVESLRLFGAEVEYHIPLRMQDGYGLSGDALRRAAASGCRLVLTVDCGVSALAEAQMAKELGLDLIITDHHQPPATLPECLALVNPHLAGNQFPWPDLAGVGVAFFLLLGLRRQLRESGWFAQRPEPDLRQSLDLVALGTIADMVPLGGINRVLVRYGLQLLDQSQRPGIVALKKVAAVSKVSCGTVGFRLAPRLNAAGRLEDAALGVQLLLGEGDGSLHELASHLDCCNRERQQIEEQTLNQAIAAVESGQGGDFSLVLASEGWHAGVIGIVASRLVERYHRPTVMIALEDGVGKGSARSIRGFHLFEALQQAAANLKSFGGHAAAAGLSLPAENLDGFRRDFEQVAAASLSPEDLLPLLEHDGEVTLDELSLPVVRQLAELAPFGIGNPQPAFVARRLEILRPQIVGQKHLRFSVRAAGTTHACIAFGMAERIAQLSGSVDLLFRPDINSFRGQDSVQLQVVDFRATGD